jgi:cell division protein FtsW
VINSRQKGFESKRLNLNSAKMPLAPGGRSSSGSFGSKSITSFASLKSLFLRLSTEFSLKLKRRKRPDYSILLILGLLVAIGTLTLYAISPAVLQRTGGGLGKQTIFLSLGLFGMFTMYRFTKLDFVIRYSPYLMVISLILCLLILVPGIGKVVYGGRRWIGLGPFTMQPSELVKAASVIFLSGVAVFLKRSSESLNKQVAYLLSFAMLMGFMIMILQKDLGTTLVISMIMLFVLISAGIDKSVVLKLVMVAVLAFAFSILSFGYRRERVLSFFDKTKAVEAKDESPADYHLRQSLIAIGSGGVSGRGVGKSVQSFGYLPEAPSDSIFAVYAEKSGLLGSIVLLGLFGALIRRMLLLRDGLDDYWSSVVGGMTGWVVGNFAVNMGSILGLIPFTGVPLPFFSLGGTSLVILLGMMGIVLNLSTYRSKASVYGSAGSRVREGGRN